MLAPATLPDLCPPLRRVTRIHAPNPMSTTLESWTLATVEK
jgi:hypothetical protein